MNTITLWARHEQGAEYGIYVQSQVLNINNSNDFMFMVPNK